MSPCRADNLSTKECPVQPGHSFVEALPLFRGNFSPGGVNPPSISSIAKEHLALFPEGIKRIRYVQ